MNNLPPDEGLPEDVDEQYRRASALDPSRPSEAVRRAVLAQARQLAAQYARADAEGLTTRRPRASPAWWRPAIFGTFAAAALAALMIAPGLLAPPTPRVAETPVAQDSLSRAVPAAGAPQPERRTDERPAPAPAAGSAGTAEPDLPLPAARPPHRRTLGSRPSDAPASGPAAMAAQDSASAAPAARAESPSTGGMGGGPEADQKAAAANVSAAQPRTALTAVPHLGAVGRPRWSAADPATEFRRAAQQGDVTALDALLGKQTDIDSRDPQGRTALMLATLHGQTVAVVALLEYGADPNAADSRGTTPLQAAMAAGQTQIVSVLQRHGAR